MLQALAVAHTLCRWPVQSPGSVRGHGSSSCGDRADWTAVHCGLTKAELVEGRAQSWIGLSMLAGELRAGSRSIGPGDCRLPAAGWTLAPLNPLLPACSPDVSQASGASACCAVASWCMRRISKLRWRGGPGALHKRGCFDRSGSPTIKGAAQRAGEYRRQADWCSGAGGQDGPRSAVHIGLSVPMGKARRQCALDLGTRPRAVIRQLAVNNALEMILVVCGAGTNRPPGSL